MFCSCVEENVHTVLTFGWPLTEQLRVALYPAITERFTRGRVNLGASDRSCSLWVGGVYTTPEQTGSQTVSLLLPELVTEFTCNCCPPVF